MGQKKRNDSSPPKKKKKDKSIKKKPNARAMSSKFGDIKKKKKEKQNGITKKVSTKKKRSDRDVSLSQKFDRYGLGKCFTTSISLPFWPWLKLKFIESEIPIHQKGKYSVIIRSGTYTSNLNTSTENDLIIFNSKHLYHT